jgi:hypothetical protein
MTGPRTRKANRVLRFLSGGLLLGVVFSGLSFVALGWDPLAIDGLGIPCPFHAITGVVCPGCGMTRALLLVGQLQWSAALRMNPWVFLLLGFAVLLATRGGKAETEEATRRERWHERLAVPALGLVLLHWVHTIAA